MYENTPAQNSYSPQNAQNKSFLEKLSTLLKNKKFLAGLVIFLIILGIGALTVMIIGQDTQTQNKESEKSTAQKKYEQELQNLKEIGQPKAIVLYGALSEDAVDLYAFDLENTQEYLITSLPLNIKQITTISDSQLIYLAQTDDLDFADKLVLHDLESGKPTTLYEPPNGYQIDGYILSTDNSYIVTWEILKGPTGALQGGSSRLRAINLTNPNQVTTIVDETVSENNPIYYPVLATADRKVYLDSFLPNSGSGWAYGMSIADINTTQINSLTNMSNGTYGTRPVSSSDGTRILLAGYDGSQGPGTSLVDNHRQALVTPNTLEYLTTENNQRQLISNLPEENIYLRVAWGLNNNSIIYTALDDNADITEFLYNISNETIRPINSSPNKYALAQLSDDLILQGTVSENTPGFPSNLSSETLYQYSYTNLEITNLTSNNSAKLPSSSLLLQYIDTIYSTSSPFEVSIQSTSSDNRGDIIRFGKKIGETALTSLQLKEFPIPTKVPKRELISDPNPNPEPERTTSPSPNQPTDSPGVKPAPKDPNPDPDPSPNPSNSVNCHDIVDPICRAKFPYDPALTYTDPNWPNFQECRRKMSKEYMADGKCDWTPLYLYGPKGLSLTINFHTPTSNSNVPNDNGRYTVILNGDGTFTSDSKTFKSISSDYKPARKIAPPIYGKVVSKHEITSVTKKYATNLGLTEIESQDVISTIKRSVSSPYAFITFYSQETSKYILPITFTPQPDTYINYVFYVRNLEDPIELGYTPQEPQFPEITPRGGISAVEISVISD